jgi:hypothetical protein
VISYTGTNYPVTEIYIRHDPIQRAIQEESPAERRARLALEKARMAYGSERKKAPAWKRPPDVTGRIWRRH